MGTLNAEQGGVLARNRTTARSPNLGAIWEINFSTSNDSSKLEVYFTNEARQRLRELQNIPEYNTQLSFVSIVGGRGVGKSTVASLLSGNSTLFNVSIFFKNGIFSCNYCYIDSNK